MPDNVTITGTDLHQSQISGALYAQNEAKEVRGRSQWMRRGSKGRLGGSLAQGLQIRVPDPDPDWIRIQSDHWIRIRNLNTDPDPGGQK